MSEISKCRNCFYYKDVPRLRSFPLMDIDECLHPKRLLTYAENEVAHPFACAGGKNFEPLLQITRTRNEVGQ